MAKQTIEQLIEGGKATPGPPLGPMLGPMGLNIQQVINEVNEKTKEFEGMKIPIKITVDTETKDYNIKVGSPTASALIKKEAKIEKGAANPQTDKVADLAIEQVIKVAKMREDSLLGTDNLAKVKEIIGTCQSMGVLVEGKSAKETITEINNGQYRKKIMEGKTELTEEEIKELEREKKELQQKMEERRAEFEEKAKSIIAEMKEEPRAEITKKLKEAEIPEEIYKPLLPAEEGEAEEGEAAEEKEKREKPKKEEKSEE